MYYRVAIQVEAQPPWKWQSTVLSSLNTLFQWLQVYEEQNPARKRQEGSKRPSYVPPVSMEERQAVAEMCMKSPCSFSCQLTNHTVSYVALPWRSAASSL